MEIRIPDKLYFKIGEVALLTGIKPPVLRYWESEFAPFRPVKSSSRQRLYRREDIRLVLRLKDLLYTQGFTIAGARRELQRSGLPEQPAGPESRGHQILDDLRRDLLRLRQSLDEPT